MTDGRARLGQLEERREKVQADAAVLLSEYSEVKAALNSARYQVEQANARQAAIAEESLELDNEQRSAEEQLRESRSGHSHGASEDKPVTYCCDNRFD